MNYLVKRTILGIIAGGLLSCSAWAQSRIGTIDLAKVFDSYWKTKQAQTVLKERQADMEKELKNMLEDRRKAREAYDKQLAEANDQAVSPEEREKRKKAAEEKLRYLKDQEDTIAQYERQARVTLEEQGRRMRDNILSEIRNIVNARAKNAGFTLVIDTAAETPNRTPVVLFTNNENDITQAVLGQLNATAPADTGGTEEKKDDKKDEKKDEKK